MADNGSSLVADSYVTDDEQSGDNGLEPYESNSARGECLVSFGLHKKEKKSGYKF